MDYLPKYVPNQPVVDDFDPEDPATWCRTSSWDRSRRVYTKHTSIMGKRPLHNVHHAFPSDKQTEPSAVEVACVQTIASRFAENIFQDFNTLREILDRYEATIRSIWASKSAKQRKAVLEMLWPNMPSKHRPDMEALRVGSTIRSAYMWTYINLEDLTSKHNLLLLLNARGRNSPHVFALQDLESSRVGIARHIITPSDLKMPLLYNYTMKIFDQTDSKSYGKISPHSSYAKAMDLHWTPDSGVFVLEMQEKLLRFLVQCCQQILEASTVSELVDLSVPKQPDPSFLGMVTARGESDYVSVSAILREAQYRVPASPDFDRLKNIVESQRTWMEDHIYALREDPKYFASYIMNTRNHDEDFVWGIEYGVPYTEGNRTTAWHKVITGSISRDYLLLSSWHALEKKLGELGSLHKRSSAVLRSHQKPPRMYAEALHATAYLINATRQLIADKFKEHWYCAPKMRKHFIRETVDGCPTVNPGTNNVVTHSNDHLLWLLASTADHRSLFNLGAWNIFDEIEKVLGDPEQKARLSPYLLQILSELGVIAEAQRQFELFKPGTWSGDDTLDSEERTEALREANMGAVAIIAVIREMDLERDGNPEDGRFDYPSDAPANEHTVKQMREAERKLDAFWKRIDTAVHNNIERTIHFLSGLPLRRPRRTPPWQPPRPIVNANAALTSLGLSELRISPQEDRFDKKAAAQVKTKKKTRKTGPGPAPTAPPEPLAIDELGSEVEVRPPDRINVTQRAAKVFRALFSQPGASDAVKEVTWRGFLQAMDSAGLKPEKLYGSVWQFVGETTEGRRGIHFHEPHGGDSNGKLSLWTARGIGRRLTRRFGWSAETFTT